MRVYFVHYAFRRGVDGEIRPGRELATNFNAESKRYESVPNILNPSEGSADNSRNFKSVRIARF